jgi:hypothetical protein
VCFLWADCLDNVGSLTSHNPSGLHGLLRDSFTYFYIIFLYFIDEQEVKINKFRIYNFFKDRSSGYVFTDIVRNNLPNWFPLFANSISTQVLSTYALHACNYERLTLHIRNVTTWDITDCYKTNTLLFVRHGTQVNSCVIKRANVTNALSRLVACAQGQDMKQKTSFWNVTDL